MPTRQDGGFQNRDRLQNIYISVSCIGDKDRRSYCLKKSKVHLPLPGKITRIVKGIARWNEARLKTKLDLIENILLLASVYSPEMNICGGRDEKLSYETLCLACLRTASLVNSSNWTSLDLDNLSKESLLHFSLGEISLCVPKNQCCSSARRFLHIVGVNKFHIFLSKRTCSKNGQRGRP